MKVEGKINDGCVGKGTFTGAGEIGRLQTPNPYLTLFILLHPPRWEHPAMQNIPPKRALRHDCLQYKYPRNRNINGYSPS